MEHVYPTIISALNLKSKINILNEGNLTFRDVYRYFWVKREINGFFTGVTMVGS